MHYVEIKALVFNTVEMVELINWLYRRGSEFDPELTLFTTLARKRAAMIEIDVTGSWPW